MVIKDHRSHLGLGRLHGIPVVQGFYPHRCRRVCKLGILVPVGDRILKGMLHLGIYGKINVVTTCAQFVFYGRPVGFGVQHPPLFQQMGHHVLDGIFHKVGHIIQLVIGGFFQHRNRIL